MKMLVDCMDSIRWNSASFKRLVLPTDYKELILAFVDSHSSQGDGFDDIIQGKGRGIVILLSGVPGVGKTLTAEAGKSQVLIQRRFRSLLTSCFQSPKK